MTGIGRTSSKRPRRVRSRLVSALLVASLWRAPVPWIHSHQTLEAQGLPEAALAWHVHNLHSHESEHSIFGWHIHLSYPWDVSNEPAPLREPDAPKPRSVYDMPYVVSQVISTADLDRHTSSPLTLSADTQFLPVVLQLDARSLFDRHLPSAHPPKVSLRALNCVVQC
jgi:hypothetical protein